MSTLSSSTTVTGTESNPDPYTDPNPIDLDPLNNGTYTGSIYFKTSHHVKPPSTLLLL